MSDDLLEQGLDSLRSAQPRTGAGALVDSALRRRQAAQLTRLTLGCATAAGVAATLAIAMRPVSALAGLRDAARHTEAVRPIRVLHHDPVEGDTEMWFLWDRMLMKTPVSLSEQKADGNGRSYRAACLAGHLSKVDAHTKNLISNANLGTIDLAIQMDEQQRNAQVEKRGRTTYHGKEYTCYRLTDSNPISGANTVDYFVDPDTQLIRHIEDMRVGPDGTTQSSQSEVDYPDAATAEKEEPRFPAGLAFYTDSQIESAFLKAIRRPEQVKSFHGIRVEFYGLVLRTRSQYLLPFALTRGGATADVAQDRYAELSGAAVAPVSAKQIGPGDASKSHLGFGRVSFWSEEAIVEQPLSLDGRSYVVNCSNQLLTREPREVTVRVPVWKSNGRVLVSRAANTRDMKFTGRQLVGYVRFKTRRIFCDDGSETLDMLQLRSGPGALGWAMGAGAPGMAVNANQPPR